MPTDTGPQLGLKVHDCATVADVDAALAKLTARRVWIHAQGQPGDSDTDYFRLSDAYLERRSTLALAAMVKT